MEWMSEWLLFNVTWTILQLYRYENKLHFDNVHFVLDQQLDCYSTLKKNPPVGRYAHYPDYNLVGRYA